MQKSIKKLHNEFKRIKEMGWIEEKRTYKGAAGYTFETLLEKEEDNFPVPDYDDIEIKTINKNTKTNVHLFNLIPDGDYLFPIKRILYTLGLPYKGSEEERYFYRSFNAAKDTFLAFGRKGKLELDYRYEKLNLKIYNNRHEDIDIGVSWSFDYIKERLELKLKYLAVIKVESCIISGVGYYHYDSITFYKLKDFKTFIRLIDDGIIEVTFKIGVHRDGPKKGKIYDHGTDFSISLNDIDELYDVIDITD